MYKVMILKILVFVFKMRLSGFVVVVWMVLVFVVYFCLYSI